MAKDNEKTCKDGGKECDATNSSTNNSVAEFVEATSVDESSEPSAVDKTTEVSPMDKGAEDELDAVVETKSESKPAEDKPDSNKAPDIDEEPVTDEPNADAPDSEDSPAPAENDSNNLQEIAANIGRPDSKVTSNSPKKESEPAEHIDLDKTA